MSTLATGRSAVAFAMALVMTVMTAQVKAPAALADPLPATCDREMAAYAWQIGGPAVRDAAATALVGPPEQVCQFLETQLEERTAADDRASVSRLAAKGGPALRQAARQALDSTDTTAIRSFLERDWHAAFQIDQRVRVTQMMAAGGALVKAAGQNALNAGTPTAIRTFLESGWQAPNQLDLRIRVTQILSAGGPEVRRLAQIALNTGDVGALTRFINVEWEVASARDAETATLSDLANAATEAGVIAAQATVAAKQDSDRAVVAADAARAAAQRAAEAAERAQGNAAAAAEAAKLAASAAQAAADAAQEASAASDAATAAARVAASAAARAAAAASQAGQAAAEAYNAAAAAATDAGKAAAARAAAQAAREVAAGARRAADAAAKAGEAAQQAGAAATAAMSAAVNSANAAAAAARAADFANAASAEAAKARAAAAAAAANAERATRAAAAAIAFANLSASAAFTARDAANRAVNDANAAAAAADEAAAHAGEAQYAAQRATAHANAATIAAQAAVDAATRAAQVYEAARTADEARYAEFLQHGEREAATANALVQQAATEADWDATQARKRTDETSQLIAEATAPGTEPAQAVVAARKAALNLANSGGPWTRSAARTALGASDTEVMEFVRNGITVAAGQDDRVTLSAVAESGSDAMKQAAAQALAGTDAQVATFLTNRDYPGRDLEDRIKVSQILAAAQASGGNALIQAAQAALDAGTAQALRDFLATGQYAAAAIDDRIAATQLIASPTSGPFVRLGAQIALQSPPGVLRQFLAIGRYTAARRDYEELAHQQVVAGLVHKTTQAALKATQKAQEAQAVAATARGASAEAAAYAQQAAASAAAAASSAQQAQQSAAQAEASAAEAAASARQAQESAASANAAAQQAAQSAAWARSSAAQAAKSAQEAYEAYNQAFESAIAAGLDSIAAIEAANAAFTSASNIARQEWARWALNRGEECQRYYPDLNSAEYQDCIKIVTQPTSTLYRNGRTCAFLYQQGSQAFENCINGVASPTFELDRVLDFTEAAILVFAGPMMVLLALEVVVVTVLLCNAVCATALTVMSPEMLFGLGLYDSMLISMAYGTAAGTVAGARTFSLLEDAWVQAEVDQAALARLVTALRNCTPNSFAAGTRVLMADGSSKPIERVRVGDRVMSTDPVRRITESQPATATITGSGPKTLIDVGVNGGGSVTATRDHPFWLADQNQWRTAGELRAGQMLRTGSGTWAQISTTRAHSQQATVHNLTIARHHTYYVLAGNKPILVHNIPCPAGTSVRYNGTPMAALGYRARIEANSINLPWGPFTQHPGGNVAVAEVMVDGEVTYLIGFSAPGVQHSEIEIIRQIDRLRAEGKNVGLITKLYSERQPCSSCRTDIANYLAPDVEVTWSVPWSDNPIFNQTYNEILAGLIRIASGGQLS